MLRMLSEKAAALLIKNGADPEMRDVYTYGCEGIISTVLILALLTAAGFILGKPLHMLVFILAWLPLRIIVGGAHANTHWMCTLVSVGLGTASVWLSDAIGGIPAAVIIVLCVCCYLVFFLFAPVIHENHPISKRRYRRTRIAARIFSAVECGAIVILAITASAMTAPAFMGCFTTAVFCIVGWFCKNTIRSIPV